MNNKREKVIKILESNNVKGTLIVLAIVIVTSIYALSINKSSAIWGVHFIASLFLALSIFISYNYILKKMKGEELSKGETLGVVLNIFFYLSFIINAYYIVLNKDKIPYFSYFIVIFSFVGMLLFAHYIQIKKRIEDKGLKKSILDIIGRSFALVLPIFIFLSSSSSEHLFKDKKVIEFGKVEIPIEIEISKHEKTNLNNIKGYLNRKRVEISDKELIDKFFSQLDYKKLENLRGIEYYDYFIKNNKKFNLYIDGNINYSGKNNKEKGYIDFIDIYDDGVVILGEYDREEKTLQHYKVKVSEDIIKEIINFYENNKCWGMIDTNL